MDQVVPPLPDIARLSSTHNLKPFSGGGKECLPLKTFLQKQALDFQQAQVAQTYVALEGPEPIDGQPDGRKVIGYITLTCSEINLEDCYHLDDCPRANAYATLPAIKIARLAVDARYRRRKIGECLVDLAISIAQDEINPLAGCRFVVTDAKQDAIAFYQEQGFTLLDSLDNQERDQPIMFMDLTHLDNE